MGAAWSFNAGVSVGMKMAAAGDVLTDALDSVYDAADAVIGYLRTVASSAFEKLNQAAAFVKDIVIRLVRRLRGRKEAAAARREVRSAAAADASVAPWEPRSSLAASMAIVLSTASSRVAGFRRLQDVKTGLPPPSSATAPGKEFALQDSVAAPAARAARRASEMMALLETAVEAMVDSARIPGAARSCICVVAAAVGLGLEAIVVAAAKDA